MGGGASGEVNGIVSVGVCRVSDFKNVGCCHGFVVDQQGDGWWSVHFGGGSVGSGLETIVTGKDCDILQRRTECWLIYTLGSYYPSGATLLWLKLKPEPLVGKQWGGF